MPTFATFYEGARFTKPLMRQLMAVLQRDMQASLDNVTGVPGLLPAPVEWNFSLFPDVQWPTLHIYPTQVRFNKPDTVQSRYSEVGIEVVVGISNQDPNLLSEQIQDYIRAVDGIIASLGAQVNANFTPNFMDFYTALPLIVPFPQLPAQSVINIPATVPITQGSVCECIVVAHAYDQMDQLTTGFVMRGKLAAKIIMEETP